MACFCIRFPQESFRDLVQQAGIEPASYKLMGNCSTILSYCCIIFVSHCKTRKLLGDSPMLPATAISKVKAGKVKFISALKLIYFSTMEKPEGWWRIRDSNP